MTKQLARFNAQITDQLKSYKGTELQLGDLLYPSALSQNKGNKAEGLQQNSGFKATEWKEETETALASLGN